MILSPDYVFGNLCYQFMKILLVIKKGVATQPLYREGQGVSQFLYPFTILERGLVGEKQFQKVIFQLTPFNSPSLFYREGVRR